MKWTSLIFDLITSKRGGIKSGIRQFQITCTSKITFSMDAWYFYLKIYELYLNWSRVQYLDILTPIYPTHIYRPLQKVYIKIITLQAYLSEVHYVSMFSVQFWCSNNNTNKDMAFWISIKNVVLPKIWHFFTFLLLFMIMCIS